MGDGNIALFKYIRCRNCGKFFTVEEVIEKIYCSEECSRRYGCCITCGKYFILDRKPYTQFCSSECAKAFNKDFKGEKNMKLVFIGPPGTGKGTMAKKISDNYRIPHISTGDLFRAEIDNDSDLGKQVKAILDSGDLVPDDITVEIVKRRFTGPDVKRGFILDGFPRTITQAEQLKSFCELHKVINFHLSDDVILERLAGRRVCRNCGTNYHVKFMPPRESGKCDKCGGELYIREDDRPEAIKKRLKKYRKESERLIEFYKKEGLLINLDASPHPDVMLKKLIKVIEEN